MYPPASGALCAPARRRLVSLSLVSLLLLAVPARFIQVIPSAKAAIPVPTATATTQNFDGIGTTATAALPTDFRADRTTTGTAADARKVGNYSTAGAATTQFGGANLSSTATNGIYNFGSGTTTAGGTDRAIGFLSSGSATASGNLYAQLVNNTGGNLSGLQISYDVEKYRGGSNPAGFRIQLFYSTDGATWTSAGSSFTTAFAADTANSGFATAPGVTTPVSSTLNVTVPASGLFYLAWNYSVSSGTTYTNSQALAVDNISIKGIQGNTPTNPTGVGAANPGSVAPTGTTLLTVAVTPGANPASTAHTVTADLSAIGGSGAQQLFDNGTNGDAAAGDNVFSYAATVAANATGGAKTLPVTIAETAPGARVGSASISLTVLSSTNPSGAGSASPNSVLPGASSQLTVNVTPGANPGSTGLAVVADLSAIGGSNAQAFSAAGGNTFTFDATVAGNTTAGAKTLPVTVTDAQGRAGTASIALNIEQPPPPLDHVVISQVYGGGGNANAPYTYDYVELYNPTTQTVTVNRWSVQYGSATGTTWTNRQTIGGVIAPGEYYLVRLGTGDESVGSPHPVDPNITGEINLSASNGKVALVRNSQALSGGACPVGADPDIVDFVGYGTANCREGGANAPALSNTTALYRKSGGSTDANQNGSDFVTGAPLPRRTAPIVELGPWVADTEPQADGAVIPNDATVSVNFSEPVDAVGAWYNIACSVTGAHNDATVSHTSDFKTWAVTPNINFQFGELCTVNVNKDAIHDRDTNDGAETDTLFEDYTWSFTVVGAGDPAPYLPSVHLTMGNPSDAAADLNQPNNYLMEKPAFTLSYNRDKGTPNWVSWHLDNSWYGSLARFDTFRADPAVPADWYRVQSTDYFASGFDRGHMTPNADRDHQNRVPLNQATFLMSNMIPQAPDNNQGPWANLENYLRTLTDTGNEIYIVAGGACDRTANPDGTFSEVCGGTGSSGFATTIAGGHVTVPSKTWKVALVIPKGDDDVSRVTASTRVIAVILPNTQGIRTQNNPNDWQAYLTSVDQVEALTGYDLFENLPDAVENAVEAGVNGSNPPGTEDGNYTTAEDVPTMVTMMAAGASSSLTYTLVTQPAHGTLSGAGPTRVYTPAPGFSGTDSFTFRVTDGARNSNTSTVTILVTEVNDAPAAADDARATQEDTPLTFAAAELAANDSAGGAEESGQTLTVDSVSAGPSTNGAVALNGGTVTYTPAPNYNGPASFTYRVCDNGNTSGGPDPKCATASVNVAVAPVNDAPAAAADSAATDEDTPVSVSVRANDVDVDGDALSVSSYTQGAHGAVSDNGDGSLKYTPAANYNGGDSFAYTLSDGHGGTATATVSVTVAPVNDAPAAAADSASTDEDTPVDVNVRANDEDVDGDALSVSAVTQGAHGGVAIVDNGARVRYTPSADYIGADAFTYTVSDGQGGTSTASVSVTVRDKTAPVLSVPGGITAEATGAGGAAVTYAVSATDNSGAAPSVQCSPLSGSLFPLGTTNVNCTATDGSGNTSPVSSFHVSVVDTTAPALSLPATVIADAASAAGADISFSATATDAVAGAPQVACAPASGSRFPVGQTAVNCSATDGVNTSTGSFLVYVNPYGTAQEAAPLQPSQDAAPVSLTVETAGNQSLDLSLDFGGITTPGVVTVEPIADPAQIGQIPEGFAVSNLVAFQIDTTAVFESDASQGKGVVIGFVVPPVDNDNNGVDDITPEAFNELAVLHNNNGVLESLEVVSRDYGTRTISAKTYSFSPFYLARKVTNKVTPLFDRSQAYKSGSTIPVKVKLVDAGSGRNLSSSSTPLKVRGVRLTGSPASASVQDAGQSNPDYDFRFVGAPDGGSYIYNLSTKGLPAGHYVLSVFAGEDRSFFHTISFDIK